MRTRSPVRLVSVWCVLLLASGAAFAAEPDWAEIADQQTVQVITTDPDGDGRETKIWVVVLDGVGYIRTSRSSTWGDNVELNPDIGLRVTGQDYPLRATFIEQPAERERIVTGFEAKYGANPLLNFIRGNDPRIMRLDSR